MKSFPIGFWNYSPIQLQKPSDVKDWHELGMTYANSPEYPANASDAERANMLAILDECEKYGIKVILCDARARWYGAATKPEAYRAKFREALADFGSHPAVFGFHVGDEPMNDEAFADAAAAHRLQLEEAPHLMPHINFNPYWKGQEATLLKALTFTDWAIRFKAEANLSLLCYDCYAQMNPGLEGLDFYYTNLKKFSDAARDAGLVPWTTLLSVGHFRYRCPSEDDLRWQLNTAVATGMKGILWFFVYERAPHSNYRVPPIDEFGERTETYTWLSRVNRHFQHQFGGFFLEAKHIATYHVGKSYGGFDLFEPNATDPTILDVTCEHGLPAVVGFFELEGHRYVALVNNSPFESGLFKLTLPLGHTLRRYCWNRELSDVKYDHHDAFYAETANSVIAGDWLAPGQMKLYMID